MTRYEQTRDALGEALGPVADYVQRAHATVDAADPAQAGKLRHVTQIEAVIEAVADFGEVVDAHMSGPDWQRIALLVTGKFAPPPANISPFLRKCQAFIASPQMQARAALSLAERQRLATINSYSLPIPDSITALFDSHGRPL